jgi:hypothetical protein
MIVADPVIQHQERPPAGLDRWSANQGKPDLDLGRDPLKNERCADERPVISARGPKVVGVAI